jgi:rhomboid protease GluP
MISPRQPDSVERAALPSPVVHDPLVRPVVAYSLLGLSIFCYLLQSGSQLLIQFDLPALLGSKINDLILQGQVWRFFTPMLLHGSLLHLGFNMYALHIIGAPLERRFGHGRFLLLYLAGAFAGNVFSFLFTAATSLGASTAIFGLLGAQAVFLYRHRELFGKQARAALQNILQVAAINFLIGLTPGIDNWAHLGGLLGGLLFTWISGPVLILKGAFPVFEIEDQRNASLSLVALMTVLLVFGALAATKFFAQ